MMARESIEKMAAGAFREVGILIYVIANLERVISGHITGWWTLTAIVISACSSVLDCTSRGDDLMNDYTSLLIGGLSGLAGFIATVIHMRHRIRQREALQGKLHFPGSR